MGNISDEFGNKQNQCDISRSYNYNLYTFVHLAWLLTYICLQDVFKGVARVISHKVAAEKLTGDPCTYST